MWKKCWIDIENSLISNHKNLKNTEHVLAIHVLSSFEGVLLKTVKIHISSKNNDAGFESRERNERKTRGLGIKGPSRKARRGFRPEEKGPCWHNKSVPEVRVVGQKARV